MHWNKDKSIVLSQACLLLFALLLAALDIGAYRIVRWFAALREIPWQGGAVILAAVYAGSIFGWLLLWNMRALLANLRAEAVFIPENVRHLRAVSWCCAGAAAISLAASLVYVSFLFVFVAAGFMALIVRIVKNIFQQAVAMKDELDLTV